MINPSDRCHHISELFNHSFVQTQLLRRVKYYHLPYQKHSLNISCFYDDVYLCLCYDFEQQRLANFFEFNHNMKYDCLGQSACENEGQCFQEDQNCPRKSLCICSPCFYGTRCQFSVNGFGLSLDAILGYHIQSQLNMNQWLNACVAVERVITFIKGINFRKEKSKRIAKLVLIILLIFTISTNICDPFYRCLIDEENEHDKRIWCIATYSSSLQIYNSLIHAFHVVAPFIINIVSAIIFIAKKSRQQANLKDNENYRELLKAQLREYTNLFIAPIVLAILALPRLIISFLSKCMESTDDTLLDPIEYFISFMPPMLTCVVFVLPSKFYKEKLPKTLIDYRTEIQQHFKQVK
ncbi:unnamed protein product [Rotaria sp. Silwood2]|nr:unnamed protein product [Rotaria sp. Silwood2]